MLPHRDGKGRRAALHPLEQRAFGGCPRNRVCVPVATGRGSEVGPRPHFVEAV